MIIKHLIYRTPYYILKRNKVDTTKYLLIAANVTGNTIQNGWVSLKTLPKGGSFSPLKFINIAKEVSINSGLAALTSIEIYVRDGVLRESFSPWEVKLFELNESDASIAKEELQATKIKDASGTYYRYRLDDNPSSTNILHNSGSYQELTNIWTSNYSKVTAITHGNYNGDGYDELVIAYTSADNWETKVSPFQFEPYYQEITLYEKYGASNGSYYFSSLSSGDSDGDGFDELMASKIKDGAGTHYRFKMESEETGNLATSGSNSWLKKLEYSGIACTSCGSGSLDQVWTSNYAKVTATTHGDYNGDGYDELVIAYASADNWETKVNLFQFEPYYQEITLYEKYGASNGSYYFSSLSSGDSDGDGFDELMASKIKDGAGTHYRFKMESEETGNLATSGSNSWLKKLEFTSSSGALDQVWSDSYFKVTAMSYVDFDADGLYDLVIASSTNNDWHTRVVLYPTSGVGISLYDKHSNENNTYYFSALSSGVYNLSTPKINLVTREEKEEEVYLFELAQNYPNPFNPSTNISFTLADETDVKLEVFDILGKQVSVLVESKMLQGVHNISFNATNLNSGIYFYRITTNNWIATKKMVLIK